MDGHNDKTDDGDNHDGDVVNGESDDNIDRQGNSICYIWKTIDNTDKPRVEEVKDGGTASAIPILQLRGGGDNSDCRVAE